jgi:hypothetical protein
MALTHSGLVIMGVMLSRAIPAIAIGPLAGVLLIQNRMSRPIQNSTEP